MKNYRHNVHKCVIIITNNMQNLSRVLYSDRFVLNVNVVKTLNNNNYTFNTYFLL